MMDKNFLTVRSNPKYENGSTTVPQNNSQPITNGGVNLTDLFNNNSHRVSRNNKFTYSHATSSNATDDIKEYNNPVSLSDNILELDDDTPNPIKDNSFDNSLLPDFSNNPMFTLNSLRAGIGNINIRIISNQFSKIVAAIELNDGNQIFVPDNSLYANGILLNKDGSVSIDLSKCWDIKRILIANTNNSTGVLSFESPEFGWEKHYQLVAGNAMYGELGFFYLFDHHIVVRKSFAHYNSLRDLSVANGFSNIMWLDNNTPQIL